MNHSLFAPFAILAGSRLSAFIVALAALIAGACGSDAPEATCGASQGLSLLCSGEKPNLLTDAQGSPTGQVQCKVFKFFRALSPECACDGPGLAKLEGLSSSELGALEGARSQQASCEEQCACEFVQLAGPALDACWKREELLNGQYLSGWCFTDRERGIGPGHSSSTCPAFLSLPLRDNWSGLITCVSSQ